MSTPLMACSTAPPRPCQKVLWRSFSVTRAGSSARSPIRCGRNRPTPAATSALLVMALPTPVRPSSVTTPTIVLRSSSGRLPWGQPPSTVPPGSPVRRTSTIFIGLLPRVRSPPHQRQPHPAARLRRLLRPQRAVGRLLRLPLVDLLDQRVHHLALQHVPHDLA